MSKKTKPSQVLVQQALPVAAIIASSIGERGTVASDKALRNCCVTALRMLEHMDQVTRLADANPDLLTLPLQDAYAKANKLAEADNVAAAQEALEEAELAAEELAQAEAKKAEQAEGKKAEPGKKNETPEK